MVSNIFGTRCQFHGRWFFEQTRAGGLGWGAGERMVSEWFKHIMFTAYFISELMPLLIWQEVQVHRLESGDSAFGVGESAFGVRDWRLGLWKHLPSWITALYGKGACVAQWSYDSCHLRRIGHRGEFWQNMIHWRRKWQPTAVFLPKTPHGQHEKAKRYDTRR